MGGRLAICLWSLLVSFVADGMQARAKKPLLLMSLCVRLVKQSCGHFSLVVVVDGVFLSDCRSVG